MVIASISQRFRFMMEGAVYMLRCAVCGAGRVGDGRDSLKNPHEREVFAGVENGMGYRSGFEFSPRRTDAGVDSCVYV